nr:tape measure protein [Cellulomonas hominis]
MTVGELVAYIRADGQQFDQQVDQSGQKFQGLGRLVQAGTKVLATSFVALTTGAAAMGAAVFKIGADYNRLQQSSRAALTTLLGSAEAANAQMDKLDEFARNSPFAKQVFITAQQQLLGFGVQAEKVLPILDAVQNAVAAVGGSNEQVSQVTYALSQMQGQGKLTGETLNQLGQYGIDAAGILGAALGKTGAEIRELASKPGGIPVDEVWDPLVAGLMERFGGATANIKLQMDGALDRIKGAIRDIGSVIATPFIDPKGGGRAVEWANKVADALRALETKAKPLVALLVDRFTPALDSVTPALDKVRGLINTWDLSKVNGQLDTLTGYTPLVAAGSASLYAYGTQNIPILSKLGLSINPVVAGVAALIATSPELRAAGGAFLGALQPLLPIAGSLAKALADTAMVAGRELAPAARDLLLAAADLAVRVGTDLSPALLGVVRAGAPVAEMLAEVVSWISEIPTPVLVAVTAFVALSQVREPLEGAFSTLRGVISAFSENMEASRGVAQALGREVSGVGTLSIAAQAGVSTLGAALKTAFVSNAVGLAITGISAAISVFIGHQAAARQRVDDFKSSLDEATGAITENTRAVAYNGLEQSGVIEKARQLGVSLKDLVDAAIDPTSEGYRRLAERGREANAELKAATDAHGANAGAIKPVVDANESLWEVLRAVGVQQDQVAESQAAWRAEQDAGLHATDDLAGSVVNLNEKLQEQIQTQKDAAGVAMSLREAQIAQTESQKAATDAAAAGAQVARDQSGAVDLNAESTIAADKALLDLAARNAQVTEAMTKQNATSQELYATTVQQRDAFINTATSMGYTREEASKLATQYGLIPQTVTTKVVAETTEASGAVTRIVESLNNINGKTYRAVVRVDTQGNTTVTTGLGNMIAQADGGFWPVGMRVRPMAGGGVLSRQAQFAPAGSNILWAEDETGGETYIPHALSKRARATEFLDATAREFGYRLIPANVQPRANGSTAAPVEPVPAAGGWSRADLDYLAERIGQEVLAGARDVSALTLSAARRAAEGSRTTSGVVR